MNIRENIARLRSLYDRDLEAAEEGRKGTYDTEKHRLISKIFTDLVKNPALSSEETVFVKKVYEDLLSTSLREHPDLAMRLSAYRRTLTPPLELSDSPNPLSQMTPEEILHASGLSVYITDPEKQRFFCHFLKKGFPEQEELPLSYLGLTEIPSIFFTESFFASLRLHLSTSTTLPDIPISRVCNREILRQYLEKTHLEKKSITDFQKIRGGRNGLAKYREHQQMLESLNKRYLSGDMPNSPPPETLSRKDCQKKALESYKNTMDFIVNEARFGRLSLEGDRLCLGFVQSQEIAQEIRNTRISHFFRFIFHQLPGDLQNRWSGDFDKGADIRNFLYREQEAIGKITRFDLSDSNLEALPEEIRVFSGLEILDIRMNYLTDLTPLKPGVLPHLAVLNISRNPIQDLSFLSNLPELRTLIATNIETSDIGAIGISLPPKLEKLDLSNNQIKDLFPISFLKNLKTLNLSGNEIENLVPLKHLKKNLKQLFLAENAIESLIGLGALSELTDLDISKNRISEISSLRTLKNLENINIYSNYINDIHDLQNCTKIKCCILAGNRIEAIDSIGSSALSIRHIELQNNLVRDISCLSVCENLEFLSLQNNIVTDVSPLFPLSSLKNLVFTPQKIEVSPELTQENRIVLQQRLPNLQIF